MKDERFEKIKQLNERLWRHFFPQKDLVITFSSGIFKFFSYKNIDYRFDRWNLKNNPADFLLLSCLFLMYIEFIAYFWTYFEYFVWFFCLSYWSYLFVWQIVCLSQQQPNKRRRMKDGYICGRMKDCRVLGQIKGGHGCGRLKDGHV